MKNVYRFTQYRINHVRNCTANLQLYGQQTDRPSAQSKTAA